MHPVLLRVGDYAVPSFWAAALAGFVLGLLVIRGELLRRALDVRLAYDITLWAYVGGWAGARVFMIPTAWDQFSEHPLRFLTGASGWVWYGGVIGGAGAVLTWARRQQVSLLVIADVVAPALAVGLAFGRIGCQLAGDGDYGVPTDLPWGMSYPDGVVPTTERVHPAPLYEMAASVVLFAWLWQRGRHHPLAGSQIGRYLIATAIVRFAIEFIRCNPAWLLGMTTAQWFSLASFSLGALLVRRAPLVARIEATR
jgi:phosphatidylglycerol:prolipoprotein diacylglycerol transferase